MEMDADRLFMKDIIDDFDVFVDSEYALCRRMAELSEEKQDKRPGDELRKLSVLVRSVP